MRSSLPLEDPQVNIIGHILSAPPLHPQVMEHQGTAAARAGKLEGCAIVRLLLHGGLQIDMISQLALSLLSCRLHMGI